MSGFSYHTSAWRTARRRALARDGERCSVSRLLGGDCSPVLHVHHLRPVSEGGDPYALDNLITACSSCHPKVEAIRRAILGARGWRSCPHQHRSAEARAICERRLNRDLIESDAAAVA